MPRSLYYDRDGKPITMAEWGRLFRDVEYRRVGLTYIEGIEISTVWLGLDHSLGLDEGHPIIFETMIFTHGFTHPSIHALDKQQWRYSTLSEAQAGHEWACDLVRLRIEAVKN